VSEIPSPARIVVVLPEREAGAQARRGSRGTLAVLQGLDAQARLETVPSPEAGAQAARADGVDLVVVQGVPPAEGEPLLAQARAGGPPVLAVVSDASHPDAVEWFRRGAAECVAASADPGALAAAALERIAAARETRARRAVEGRLAWLEALNAAIVNEIPAALAVIDAGGRLVAVNPAFTAVWGGSAEALRGRLLEEALPRGLLAEGGVPAQVAAAAAGRTAPAILARGPGADGTERTFDVRAQRLDADGRVLLVLSDVTERERLGRRVDDLERYNENIVQNLNSALLVVDARGAITTANAMAAEILGEPEGSLRGRSAWEWFSLARGEAVLLARSLRSGERFRGAETFLTRRDGTVVPIGISCAPLVDADGTRHGAVAIFQDLTEITLLQRQVVQAEKMASIGQLAAGVAHEINNPMGFIHANLFQMEEYLGDLRRLWEGVTRLQKAVAADEDARAVRAASEELAGLARELDAPFLLEDFAKAIRESQEGSERIRHIVRELREFSRQDDDERVLADVNQCLDSTANIVWSMMKHTAVLQKRYADLPSVRCDPMQLKQVFMNLLVNAYQAIEERLGETGERGEIELVTERRGDRVVVAVSDTGVGIRQEHLERIFDPFFTTKEVGAGTGLGLSTSYNIVRKHGGDLRARNRRGPGATFEVVLPVASAGARTEIGRRS